MNKLTQTIVSYATGYNNAFNNRVMSIESTNNIISIRFRINANQSLYSIDMINVFANATYNVSTESIKILTENSTGSRKYNYYVKNECTKLINMFVSESKKIIDVEQKELNSAAYDRCHLELLSLIDQTNPTHKNICYGYINQIQDLYVQGANVEQMELKLIDVKNEMLSDVRLFPEVESNPEYKTIWCKLENGSFVIVRSRPSDTAIRIARELTESCINGREYIAFPDKFNPNYDIHSEPIQSNPEPSYTAYNRSFPTFNEANAYCIQSDFDPTYIQSSTVSELPLQLDLQMFAANPTYRTIHESNYDTFKIITTQSEYEARIHPSDEHTDKHKICFSSDDYFYIDDSDIISVSRLYRKTIITEHGVQKWGIGKGLDLAYVIETTKTDPNIDDINYSNIHKYNCNSIQKTIEWFNRMQKAGYHNISIQTNVNYKNTTIIYDSSDVNIEMEVNTEYIDKVKKENREYKQSMEYAAKKISDYEEFIKRYNSDKLFEQYIKDRDSKPKASESIVSDSSNLIWYEMLYRPLSPSCQPKDHIQYDDSKGKHGIIAYNRPLTGSELLEYELRLFNE